MRGRLRAGWGSTPETVAFVWQYLFFRILSVAAPLVPPRLAYAACDLIGGLAYRLLPRPRRSVRYNLARVTRESGSDLERSVKEVFKGGAKYYYDTFRIPALSDDRLLQIASIAGLERIDRALERGRGAIIVTAHLGSPALVAQLLGLRGFKVTTPAEPVKPDALFELLSRVRGGRGIKLVPLSTGITRELTEALGRNELVGLVADRDLQGTGVLVDFFGAPFSLPAGPVMLAMRTGAAIVPGFTCRTGDGRFEGYMGEEVQLESTGNLKVDVKSNTQRLAGEMEKGIRRCPRQWVVFQRVWPEPRDGDATGVAV